VATFESIVQSLCATHPACRGVVRAARIVGAGLRYLDAAWDFFVEPLARKVDAALLQAEAALEEPDASLAAGADDTADLASRVAENTARFAAVTASLLAFRAFETVDDDDVLWDRLCAGFAVRAALGPFADGAFVAEVREARARAAMHVPTISTERTDVVSPGAPPSTMAEGPSSSTTAVHTHARREVTRLGRYRLERRLGQGGMAEVFLAVQDGPHGFTRNVVVKRILAEHAADPHFIAMFQREAAVISRLQHPNIVDVYELGVEGDLWFIAMELLDGLSLQNLSRRGELPVAVLARVILDAAAGLAFVHDRGVVHRDISPDNLFVTRSGLTKVIDFGVARGDDTLALTQAGELKGKIPFMAPEMLRGDAFGAPVDVFALGVTLWSLLIGRRPWQGPTLPALMRNILEVSAVAPSTLREGVPPIVDELVVAMLASTPADRPEAATVASLLASVAADPSAVTSLLSAR
jgi:hypothetical protein